MSKEDEAAARNIKLVRYTHPSPQNWKGKDGLEKSRSLPVQHKKKSEGRLMDMLKSRSAKFHNLTVNRSLSAGPKDTRNGVKKNKETCFLPVRTPNTVSRPNPISPSAVQKLNLDTRLIPGNNSSNHGSFTSNVKKMLEEQRPQLNSIQKQQPVPHTSSRSANTTPKKTDGTFQGERVKSPQLAKSPQQQHLKTNDKKSEHEDGRQVEKEADHKEEQREEKNKEPLPQTHPSERGNSIRPERRLDENPHRDQFNKIPSQRQDRLEIEAEQAAEQSRPSSTESRFNDETASSSTERTTPQAIEPENRHDSIRSGLLKLFKQVETENLASDSDSNFRIVQLLQGKRSEAGEQEEQEEEEFEVSDFDERDRSLQGSVVAFEGELGPPEDSGTSRLEVVYLSDEEEEKRPRHKVLPPSSGLLRPASPRRSIPAMKDPMAEKRKNDREVAVDALAKLKDKKTFDKDTFTQIIEKGVADHRALEGNPNVSVTNDVCSVNNYETSHAYYYQQFDRRSKLAWLSLHEPTTSTGNEPLKEIWKSELLANFMSCTIFFHPITSSNLTADQQSSLDYQISQLKKLLQNKFYIKLSGSLDKRVDIVILYGQNEKVLNELLEKKQNSSFRVWSLQRALNYLQDVGIDLQEWNIEKDAQDRESILDVPISEDSIQEDIEDSTEEVEREGNKETEREEENEETKEGEREEHKETGKENAAEREENKETGKENAVEREEEKELEKEEDEELEEKVEEEPQSEKREPNPEKNAPKLSKSPPKRVVKAKSSRKKDAYVQELLQQASGALDKRDAQLKAAHSIILALSRDVMHQEVQITSLTGQLKYSKKELDRQTELAEQYRLCMAEQEVEMAQLRIQLAKKKSKKNRRASPNP
ncbi:ZYRO0A09790p [Zygosaccharomyces rouxii]|uniref:ZYRO0A09790p n=1 Tax=Zygosaccharomyces rouxii (strain ATCC 2623 / CBS 732 / NBRC 1130 / NCYC 568 / NRRL Y-229) TaxID=559307 RepID=C5DQ98_ZYGRC|nr:uncharacterized protein ZYRO0A09790g [Zygosaccharomyces rouxii]KAH9198622.1 hypothetical protein LQ764DRAFT_235632 [Zygosaccharomyces rouxii]CAR25859.1 ZYRO0A09790p [Zygosaccharomyces rouxii]